MNEQVRRAADVERREAFPGEARRRLTTVMIGALDEFELAFGRLWGGDKPPRDRTAEERWWWDRWQACRTRVLDRGNAQLRKLEDLR